MSGAISPLVLYAFMVWTGTNLLRIKLHAEFIHKMLRFIDRDRTSLYNLANTTNLVHKCS